MVMTAMMGVSAFLVWFFSEGFTCFAAASTHEQGTESGRRRTGRRSCSRAKRRPRPWRRAVRSRRAVSAWRG